MLKEGCSLLVLFADGDPVAGMNELRWCLGRASGAHALMPGPAARACKMYACMHAVTSTFEACIADMLVLTCLC